MDLGGYTRTLYFHPARQPLSAPKAPSATLARLLDVHHNHRIKGVEPPGEARLNELVRSKTPAVLSRSRSTLALTPSHGQLLSAWGLSASPTSVPRVRLGEPPSEWDNGDPYWAVGGVRREPYIHRPERTQWMTEAMRQYGQTQPGALPRSPSSHALKTPLHQALPLSFQPA